MSTMKKTGFPKGLFTPEEENVEYFSADVNHKRAFFKKLIDITKIVTKANFDIDIDNILKGLEEEKTNIFLQYFYIAATSKINTELIIKNYLKEKKEVKDLNPEKNAKIKEAEKIYLANKPQENQKKEVPKKTSGALATKSTKEKPEYSNGFILWIDSNVNNSENSSYIKYLKEHTLYKQFKLK